MDTRNFCTGLCPCAEQLCCYFCDAKFCYSVNGSRKIKMHFQFWIKSPDRQVNICAMCVDPSKRPQKQ